MVYKDGLIKGVQEAIPHFTDRGQLVFLTGRNETLRPITVQWIKEKLNIDCTEKNLFMRPLGNLDTPTQYKRTQLSKLVYLNEPTWLALDDDLYMQKVYIEYGAITLKAPECWDVLFKVKSDLPPEINWRK